MTQKKKSNFASKVANDAHRQQKQGTSYGHLILPKGVGVFSPEPGSRVKLDFMLYEVSEAKHPDRNDEAEIAVVGSLWYKRPYSLHRNIGADNNTYVCPRSIGKKCPICEALALRKKKGAEKEETDPLKPSQRNLYVVIPKGVKKFEEKPHIFDISQYNFQNLLNEELEEDNSNGIFPELEGGKTLKVRFDSKTIGGSQAFAQASRIDFEDRDEDYDEAILEDVPNLDEVLKVLSYKELESKFLEVDDEDEGGSLKDVDDDEDEKPKHKKKPVKKDNDDDDEDEPPVKKKKPVKKEEDDDDDDEEEAPPRKKKVVKKEEDEDEDDEPPVRKKKVVKKDEDDEDEDDEPVKKKKPTTTGKKNKCPHGYKFGVDHDEYDECADCKVWDECLEIKEI